MKLQVDGSLGAQPLRLTDDRNAPYYAAPEVNKKLAGRNYHSWRLAAVARATSASRS